jgi:hypothetical protein
MQRYENFVGLTEVKAAQARVVQSERRFIGKYIYYALLFNIFSTLLRIPALKETQILIY